MKARRAHRWKGGQRTLLVSCRLPFTVDSEVTSSRRRSSGGLASALSRVHERSNAVWIGWSGAPAAEITALSLDEARVEDGFIEVPITAGEVHEFYAEYSNGVLWPALHGLAPMTDGGWPAYREVNARFAEVIARAARPGDAVWVHDYHLMLVPGMLRARRPDLRVGFFLHTPFPATESLARVAQASELVEGFSRAHVVGVQTRADHARVLEALHDHAMDLDDAGCAVIHCPIGADAAAFNALAVDDDVERRKETIRAAGSGPLFVGVDRLDYTKGIPQRLLAFERLLVERPDLQGSARLAQVAVPTRENVSGYAAIRREIEQIVQRINARFATAGWRPVEYFHGSLEASALVALYRAADVMLVTPLRDGMNLVAKEFVASRVDSDGVLVLGDQAGAAEELREAVRVNVEEPRSLLGGYLTALDMSAHERRVRMRRLRRTVEHNDVYRWAARFLDALTTARMPLAREA